MPTDGQRIQKRTPATVALQVSSATQPVRPGKLLKMIVWRGGTRSDRAFHRTLRPVKLLEMIVWHGGSIKPRIPLRVAYEVRAARQQTVRSPRTMYPHSQEWHQNREATVYLPA